MQSIRESEIAILNNEDIIDKIIIDNIMLDRRAIKAILKTLEENIEEDI